MLSRMVMVRSLCVAGMVLAWALNAFGVPLMRYPNAAKTEIAFVAYDDLWVVSLQGGLAHRLTHDPGAVTTPLFSPDGHWIAYTLRRGGMRDVFVIPAEGGRPRQLTYEASSLVDGAMVVAWTTDSQRVVFLSHRSSPVSKLVRAFSVPVTGGSAEQLPLDRAGMMSFAPNGHLIAYNRIFRNVELRKRYLGGQAQDIYTYDFDKHVLKQITDWKGTDTAPMWFGREIYFLSDRGNGFRENIWSYDLDTKAFRQLTHFADYDIDWPSLGGSTITFQQGGRLFAIDLPSEHLREVKVDVPNDEKRTGAYSREVGQVARVTDVTGGLDYALSPTGDSLLLSARGDLFRVPAHAAGKDLTQTPGIDEDHPAWSPDGNTIAYETDKSGSQQIAVRLVRGGAERILTNFPSGYFYSPLWSPAGDSLVVPDANHSLWWIRLDGSQPRRIASDPYAEIRDAAFSPDGRWLAYSTERPTQLRAIHLHEFATGNDTIVSSYMESDHNPVFTGDGSLLVFISQRNEQTLVSDRDDENLIVTVDSDGLYAVALDNRAPSPLKLTPNPLPAFESGTAPIHMDLDGLMARAVALPITPATIASLQSRKRRLFYQTNPIGLISGHLAGQTSALRVFDLASREDRIVAKDLENFSLSADGTKVAFRRNDAWYLASTSTGSSEDEERLNLAGLSLTVDPPREWAEMFENAWRLDRDVFFSQVMNGSNWQAVHDAYAKLLPTLGSQDDFLYLLGQVQGEIASSHTYMVRGVDNDPRIPVVTGLLGADYAVDPASHRYRFARIYGGDQTRPGYNGPLGQPGLGIAEGDYLLAINGRELAAPASPESFLSGLTAEVTLSVASSLEGPRHAVKVKPLTDETKVRRQDWIEHNRSEVERLSSGRLGYIFVTDFSAEGSEDFVRQFYSQRDKAGIIFDVRWNRGGFTSQAVLDVLKRQQAGVFVNREGAVSPLPNATAPKVIVTLTNYASASDGDQFPYFFRKFGLGKLVGERTWGGVQGINAPWKLMDGTSITIPKDSLASLEGHWIIENEGVSPDIEVSTDPSEGLLHKDSQLIAAVATAIEQLNRAPPVRLKAPHSLPAYPAAGDVPGASFESGATLPRSE